jgi:DNA-binding response OmpR family regulator
MTQTATSKQEILIVEDDESIASFQRMYFREAGFAVTIATTGSEALSLLSGAPPALVVLDLGLPDMDGLDICKRIRDTSNIPVLIVTARDEDMDRIVGLEVGADDYVAKPFHPKELVARAKAILRRANPENHAGTDQTLEYGELSVDAGRREVKVAGNQIELSPKEFDLLWELLVQRGHVLTREQLLKRVWGYANVVETRTVDVHVRQLRQKLGDSCPISTVWGVGYKIPVV